MMGNMPRTKQKVIKHINRCRALYKGRVIIAMDEGVWAGGKLFLSLADATKAIDTGEI